MDQPCVAIKIHLAECTHMHGSIATILFEIDKE